jgi:GNAT superfamily N-acetyltransferase
MSNVRQARPADRAAVTTTVALAFADDPAWSFFFGDAYDQLASQFAGVLFDTRVSSGDVWVTDELTAVAMWEPPAGAKRSSEDTEQLWNAFHTLAGAAVWQRLSEYEQAVGAARPSTPYWYLGVLATRPDHQGEGLGTAVMAPVLEKADSDGIDCCLETSTVRNLDFYEGRGFRDVTAVHVASGPPTWWLRRFPTKPRSS